MNMITSIYADLIKLRHTPHWAIHVVVPLLGSIMVIFYFVHYSGVEEYKKIKLIMELTATVFPLLISIIIGINVSQEEKATHFQNLLAAPNRAKSILAKLSVLYLSGVISLFSFFGIFSMGIVIWNRGDLPWKLLLQSVLGLALGSFVIYIFHLFLNVKFGLGISLFWGVFECLQCILYSNIELHGLWRYIPFAWSENWILDVFNCRLAENKLEWVIIVILTFGILLAILFWFTSWEGRRNYE